ncbi:MAG: PAS domain S-box protein [Candidatus Polarisedimenticolia bacterium]
MPVRRGAARRLIKNSLFALGLVLCAQVLRWLVGLRWPVDQTFLFYHFAVVWAALIWGFFPGLFAVVASSIAARVFHQAAPEGLIVFAMSGAMTTGVASWARARWMFAKGLASSDARRLGQIVSALPELVSYIDSRHRYQFNNAVYERWFGVTSDEIRGLHIRDVLGEGAYEVIRPHLEKALGGEEVHYEAYVPYKEGGGRFVEARYVPHRDRPDGPVAGVGVLVSDVSERRRAEEQATVRTRQQEAVARLGQEALTARDIDALMALAVREVCRVLENEFGIILERVGEDGWRPRAVVGWDLTPGEMMPADFPRPAHSAYTLEHNQPIIVENARDETRFQFPDQAVALGIASGISVVVSGDSRPWGTLTSHATRPRVFTQDDIHFMQAVAHVLSEAMRRHETEQSLRESEGRFRMMADTAPVMIWMAGPENEGVYFNRPWLDFTGRALQQELGFGWVETIHPDDRERAEADCRAAFEQRRPVRLEFRMRRQDGAWRWVLDHGIPHFSPRGRFLGYIGSTVDINDLREAEEDLQRRLEQLSAIYHVSDMAGRSTQIEEIFEAALAELRRALRAERASIQLYDPDGVMRFKAWSGLSDAYRASAQGHSPWTKDTVDPSAVVIPDAAAAEGLGERRGVILQEGIRALGFVPLVAAGRLIGKFVIYHDAPHAFTDEELRLATTIGRHVAAAVERHRVDQDLRTLNETLEMRVRDRTRESERRSVQLRALALDLIETEERERRLLAQSLHDDLQQILVATRMKIGRLQGHEDPATLQPVQELLHEALQSSRRITVDLSPPILFEAGLIPALQWLIRHMRDKYGLEVALEGPGDVEVSSERHRAFLFRAARELLFNIVKHAGVGTAQIVLERSGPDAVAMEVRDQGSGFPATELEGSAGATGFGLFSIQERAEALGGHMSLASEPGTGTRVRLVLGVREAVSDLERVAQVREPTTPVASMGGKGNGSGRIRVLLADDHKIVREGLAALLSTQDDIETVAQAADGEEAVSLAMRLRPDVVVMDVSMPGLSGIEATRRITAQAPSIKVIGLSMFESEEMSLSMRTAGASCYLTKDRASETLCDVIRTEGRAGA